MATKQELDQAAKSLRGQLDTLAKAALIRLLEAEQQRGLMKMMNETDSREVLRLQGECRAYGEISRRLTERELPGNGEQK